MLKFGLYNGKPVAWDPVVQVWTTQENPEAWVVESPLDSEVDKNVGTREPRDRDLGTLAVFWQNDKDPIPEILPYAGSINRDFHLSDDGRVWRNCVIVEKSS
jgi:hypothetical protein